MAKNYSIKDYKEGKLKGFRYIKGFMNDQNPKFFEWDKPVDRMVDNKKIKGKRYEIINLRDKQLLFDYFVRNNLTPFFPEDRSVGRVKEAVYQFFRNFLNLDFENSFDKIVNIVLSDGNIKHFTDLKITSCIWSY